MNVWQFMSQNRTEVLELTLEHLWLVGVSMALAVLIGIPLGILITRWPKLNKPVLGGANIIQTVPSLALFGFLLPAPWIGERADRLAILALTLYALLPLIRNTYVGIMGVDRAVVEAGRGMGMTDRQLLFQVELPLALGVIIAGIRVPTVISVGTATIAVAIDAGGLGRYIFRGLRMNDNVLILAGAVPAALIALAADLLLGYVERLLQAGDAIRRESRTILLTAGLVFAAAGIFTVMNLFHGKTSGRVAVGSKDFTEQVILGELLAQAIESNTALAVERRFDLGGSLAHEALVAGEIDMYVEYTGTALLAILKGQPSKDPQEVYRRVKTE